MALALGVSACSSSESAPPPAYSCYIATDFKCEDYAAAPGGAFSASDVEALTADCEIGGGVMSQVQLCPTANRVGSCVYAADFPVLSTPLTVTARYYPDWTPTTASADCTDLGGTWTSDMAGAASRQ